MTTYTADNIFARSTNETMQHINILMGNVYIAGMWMNLSLYIVFIPISVVVLLLLWKKKIDFSALVTIIFYEVKLFILFLYWVLNSLNFYFQD